MTSDPLSPDPAAPAQPGFHLLALFEGLKGLLALVAAASLELMGPRPLQDLVSGLITKFNLDPHSGPLPTLLNALNPAAVHFAATVLVLYAAVRLVEAWGLWRARAWASWLGCIGTALYLPLDLFGIYYHRSVYAWMVLALNLAVFAVLARDLAKRRRQAVIARTQDAG